MPTIKVEYCGFYQYSWPSPFINLNENQSFHHVYHNKRGVYYAIHGMYGREVAESRSIDDFCFIYFTYFMSEWAYRKQHLFKNIFKLPTPSYTRYSFLKHLNSDDQSDSDHGVSLSSIIYHQDKASVY